MGKGVWGIDVSKFSVKAVRLERGPAGLIATNLGVLPFAGTDTGEPVNIDDQIKMTLARLKSQLKIGSEKVVLSLPGHSTFNRMIKLPPVDESKLAEVVKYEAQSQIPFPIDEVIWDYQFVNRQYGPGEEKEVILFAIKRDVVEQFLQNVVAAGLNVDAIQFGPVALCNFLRVDQDLPGTCIAVDLGAENSDLIVLDGPKFWIRNLPVTGNDITKAVQQAFNVPFAEAEKIKQRAAQSPNAQKIFNAIQPKLRDLIGEIQRSVGYYKSISKSARFDQIVLLGNATRTINFQKFVSQMLQMQAVRITKLNRISVGGALDAAQMSEDLTTAGTAIGLAMQGLGDTPNKINLLPPAFLAAREMKKKQPWAAGIVAAVFVLVGGLWVAADTEVAALKTEVGKAKSAETTVSEASAKLEKAKQDAAKLEAPLKRMGSLFRDRDLPLQVMNLVHPNIPDNGDWQNRVANRDKMWILEWRFSEVPRTPSSGGAMQQVRPYDGDRKLVARIEVGLDVQGRPLVELDKSVIANLLGVVASGERWSKVSGKSSVVDAFKLVRKPDAAGRFEVAFLGYADELRPLSTYDRGHKFDTQNVQKYAIFEVTLEIPTRKEVREAASAPPAPAK